jgi:hypothetical protein
MTSNCRLRHLQQNDKTAEPQNRNATNLPQVFLLKPAKPIGIGRHLSASTAVSA